MSLSVCSIGEPQLAFWHVAAHIPMTHRGTAMRSFTRSSAVATLVSALVAGPNASHATITGSATLTFVTIQIIDLDPNDGVAAAITLASGPPGNSSVAVCTADDSDFPSCRSQDGPRGGPLSVTWTTTLSAGTATLTAGSLLGGGPAPGSFVAASTQATGYMSASSYIYTSFTTITPMTRMIVTAMGTANLSSTVLGERGEALSRMYASDFGGGGMRADILMSIAADGTVTQVSDPFTISYTNSRTTGGAFNFGLYADTILYGADATPIPENGSASMMLIGLVTLVGSIYRRRRRGVARFAGRRDAPTCVDSKAKPSTGGG